MLGGGGSNTILEDLEPLCGCWGKGRRLVLNLPLLSKLVCAMRRSGWAA